ncbi:MAG: hypothetical protein NNA19_12305 [Nitrospira sp.]|nr:hypothetical protein [Nitrospira sp.]MCP9476017.1 hypothetical protein [Nitrospira sp.]
MPGLPHIVRLLVWIFVFLPVFPVHAYLADVGYTTLRQELGTTVPTGATIHVSQVEAPINDVSGGAAPIFLPDPAHPEFAGKTIAPIGGNPSGAYSPHATAVGSLFYGTTGSMAPGINIVTVYEANGWLDALPRFGSSSTAGRPRVTNHSWVGDTGDPTDNGTILRLVDRLVDRDEAIQVTGLTNGPGGAPLLGGSGYNVMAVGRTDGSHQQGSIAVDGLYGAGRAVPTLVVPVGTTSSATAVVSAAATLLVQLGHEGGRSLSQGSTTIDGVGTVYNAERSETIKAALMAGADRETHNTTTRADITDYRSGGHETANGLDSRFGAGQLNIFNSYRILAGGEQPSAQLGGTDIASYGFDYGAIGGLDGTERTASYFFNTDGDVTLFASLVWNLDVSGGPHPTARLYALDLSLYDVTNHRLIASSAGLFDNTENLFVRLLSGSRYELRVTTAETADFSWDYALAWRLEPAPAPVPLPAGAWLFASGMASFAVWMKRRAIGSRVPL